MAPAMRNQAILVALLGWLALAGCPAFTAGEPVSEPDPIAVRQAQAPAAKAPSPGAGAPGHDDVHGADGHGADVHGADKAKEVALPAAQPETATASHILIRYAGALRTTPDVTRSKAAASKLARRVARKARARGANFAALADEYTEDPSGKGRGGKLGTFPKGRMVPEFDKPLFALNPGEVSDVIETGFGFHIIHREK